MSSPDFEIEIGARGDDGYHVSVRAPDGAEARGLLRLPPEAEVQALVGPVPYAVLASSARARRNATSEETPVRRLGQTLFDALLNGDGLALLRAARQDQRLRVVLRVQPPELMGLPWEFMYDAATGSYLCLDTPLIRRPQVPLPARPLHVSPPLRILCMIAHRDDQDGLDTEDEQRRLRESVARLEAEGLVELGFTPGPTWRDLRTALRAGQAAPWHVFHFIGHGGFDERTQEGTLALTDDENGGTYHLGADDLAMLLADQPSLRLVMLNACETGRSSPLDPFSSTAGALLRRGDTSAVLAMQYPISDQAAIEFSGSFYAGIVHRVLARKPGRSRLCWQKDKLELWPALSAWRWATRPARPLTTVIPAAAGLSLSQQSRSRPGGMASPVPVARSAAVSLGCRDGTASVKARTTHRWGHGWRQDQPSKELGPPIGGSR